MNRLFPNSSIVTAVAAIGIGISGGCQPTMPAREPPIRSPSLDYRSTSTTVADGQVLGANQTSPSDQLAQGARLGSRSLFAPGWRLTDDGLVYDSGRPGDGGTYLHNVKQAAR